MRHFMRRRTFVKHCTTSLGAATFFPPLRVAAGAIDDPSTDVQPITLGSGVQLFLDNFLIAGEAGLRRVINPPVRVPAPIVTSQSDHVWQPYVSVLRDPETGLFRI